MSEQPLLVLKVTQAEFDQLVTALNYRANMLDKHGDHALKLWRFTDKHIGEIRDNAQVDRKLMGNLNEQKRSGPNG